MSEQHEQAPETILSRFRKADEMLAACEVNLRGARMQLDDMAHIMGFTRAHRPAFPAMEAGESVPYPELAPKQ